MTITEPIPDPQYGVANWADYVNNWREADAEWIQDRTILRFENATARDAGITGPAAGKVVYNFALDHLEMRSKTNAWFSYRPLPQFTAITVDDATGVGLAHRDAGGKGVLMQPTQVQVPTTLNVLNGLSVTDLTGLALKVGAKTAKLSTNATDLVVDSPLSVPSITLTGAGTVVSAPGKTLAVGTLTADTVAATSINLSGTLTGGILNGTRALIGGVNVGWDPALTVPAASAGNLFATGLVTGAGYFLGSASGPVMQQRTPTTGVLGTAWFSVQANDMVFGPTPSAGSVYMHPMLRIMGGKGVPWHNAAGTHQAWIAPTIYNASDPGAANFPDGTIWVS